jgi:hypothetical protein
LIIFIRIRSDNTALYALMVFLETCVGIGHTKYDEVLMHSTVSTCPHVGAIYYPLSPRGDYRKLCLMVHNEYNDPDDDDDQYSL